MITLKGFLLSIVTIGTLSSVAQAMDPQVAQLCNRSWDAQEKAACINRFYNSEFQSGTVNSCTRFLEAREINSCLDALQSRSFDTQALNYCNRQMDARDMVGCLNAIANKTYESFELQACQMEWDSDLNRCMANLGTSYQPYGTPSYPPATTIEEVLTDAIDRMLRDLLLGDNSYVNNRRSAQEYCRIENSNGRVIGETSVEDLQRFGQRYASESGECVVTNIYNRQRTRTLYNSQGQIVGERLTERETNDLKSGHRCRVAICMVEQNSSYNDTPTYRPTPTWSTY